MTARGFFITGTDTGVGKTVFTAALARALMGDGVNVAAYKPACSGAEFPPPQLSTLNPQPLWPDVEELHAATRRHWPRERICPQTFLAPLSPPAAAAQEGREVDAKLLLEGYQSLAEQAELVLIEGAGGFYSPLSTHWLNADLAEQIGLPVIIVSPNRLGTINHTLLTIEAVRRRGLIVAGVVLNQLTEQADASVESNPAEIERRGTVHVWGEIPFTPASELQPRSLPESMMATFRSLSTGMNDVS